jgi:hypothetical protein
MAACADRLRPAPRARADGHVGGPGGVVDRAGPNRRRPAPRGRRLVGSPPRLFSPRIGRVGGVGVRSVQPGVAVIST